MIHLLHSGAAAAEASSVCPVTKQPAHTAPEYFGRAPCHLKRGMAHAGSRCSAASCARSVGWSSTRRGGGWLSEEGADTSDELLDIERLGDEQVRPWRPVSGDAGGTHRDDAPDRYRECPQVVNQRIAIEVGHHQVSDHQVRWRCHVDNLK